MLVKYSVTVLVSGVKEVKKTYYGPLKDARKAAELLKYKYLSRGYKVKGSIKRHKCYTVIAPKNSNFLSLIIFLKRLPVIEQFEMED